MLEDIGKAVVGWGVPLIAAWLLTKVPGVRKWFESNPTFKTAAIVLLLGALVSATSIAVYDRAFVLPRFADLDRKLTERLADLDRKFTELDRTLYGASDALVAAPGNRCPPGTYAVQLTAVSVSGGNRGYLESATITCMELKFRKK